MGSPCVRCGVEAVINRGGVWFCDIHEPPRSAQSPLRDQRDEKIALLSQEVLQLRRDLKTERRRTRREKPDEERWWDALTAAAGPGVTAKQAAFFAKQALEEYHRYREPPPSEAPTTDEGDSEDRPAGGDADGPEGGPEARRP